MSGRLGGAALGKEILPTVFPRLGAEDVGSVVPIWELRIAGDSISLHAEKKS